MTHAVYHAPYACHPDASRGRQHDEPESKTRTPYQRDRDRILHCGAFRRLKHKTQVFVAHVGDYYRTRLTHSLEVAQIGRSIARELGLDEELTETLSLAHDLGHTAFGHAGEDALDAAMQPFGGFDHNAQTLRIVSKLEKRYIQFDGLNTSTLVFKRIEGATLMYEVFSIVNFGNMCTCFVGSVSNRTPYFRRLPSALHNGPINLTSNPYSCSWSSKVHNFTSATSSLTTLTSMYLLGAFLY